MIMHWTVGTVGLLLALSPHVFFSEWWNRWLERVSLFDPDDDWPGDIR